MGAAQPDVSLQRAGRVPSRPRTPCTYPRCPALVAKPGPCPEHARERDARRQREHTWRDYGPEYQRQRLLALKRKPYCDCGARAVDVDHVVTLRLGGTHEQHNLDPKCESCHSRKTATENRFGQVRS
jgi:5-methylcytosine-specific restriction enzyme A